MSQTRQDLIQYDTTRNETKQVNSGPGRWSGSFFSLLHAGTMQKPIAVNKLIVMMLSDLLPCHVNINCNPSDFSMTYLQVCYPMQRPQNSRYTKLPSYPMPYPKPALPLSSCCIRNKYQANMARLRISGGKRLNNWAGCSHAGHGEV